MKRIELRVVVIFSALAFNLLLSGCAQARERMDKTSPAAAYNTPVGVDETAATDAPTVAPTSTQPSMPTFTPTAQPCDRNGGGQVSRETLDSELLGYSYEVSVYTPPCYGEEGIDYPVLYLLHGQGMDDTYWLNMGAAQIVDDLIAKGAAPFLMVFPREVNDYDPVSEDGFGASVLSELIPWVEANYDVCTQRECRAIGGISRGGGWATRLAARNFDTFGALGAHSMGLMAGDTYKMQQHLETRSVEDYPRIWLDRGEDDFLFEGIDYFVDMLEENGIPHEFHLWPGDHSGAYWQAHVADYLAWYAEGWEHSERQP